MTRRHLRLSLNVDLVEEETDESPPSYDLEVEGAGLDEKSRVQLRPIAKAIPRGGYELQQRRRAAR